MKKTGFSLCVLALLVSVNPQKPCHSSGPKLIECSLQRMPETARHHRHAAPRMGLKESATLNWSGYAAVSGLLATPDVNAVTQVSGYWTVPTVTGNAGTYSALWVGIDGYESSTVEQLGTEHDMVTVKTGKKTSTTVQQNSTWFEMYPAGSFNIQGFPCDVGDVIGAGVAYAGNKVFTLAITNVTKNVYYVVPTSYTTSSKAVRSSAEWIAEAPSMGKILPLANFGTVGFTGCQATINGVNGTISDFPYDGVIMSMRDATHKAVPSDLTDDGSAFTVTWYHQ